MPTRTSRRDAFFNRMAEGTRVLDMPPIPDARQLPLEWVEVNPDQPRQVFDEAALDELAASIRTHGVLEPILVRAVSDHRYQVIAGERRRRAAALAELTHIPALILSDLDDAQIALITAVENLQRADLDLEDEARQFAYLLELTGLSQRKLAEQLGITHTYLSKRVRLLERPDLLAAVRAGQVGFDEAMRYISGAAPLAPPAAPPGLYRDDTRDDMIVEPTERAALDAHPGTADHAPTPPPPSPYLGANPNAAPLQRTPWRDRPLMAFMDWAARVDTEHLAATQRAVALRQVAEARAWLVRLEEQLASGTTE